jgi:hypothetical protein
LFPPPTFHYLIPLSHPLSLSLFCARALSRGLTHS